MKLTASALDALGEIAATLPVRRVLPPQSARPTRAAIVRLFRELDSQAGALPASRLSIAREQVLAKQATGAPLGELPLRTLRDAVWLIWPSLNDGIDRASLLEQILEKAKESNAILRQIIDAWIIACDSEDATFRTAGQRISGLLLESQSPRFSSWKEIDLKWGLFDAVVGPDNIAAQIMSSGALTALAECRLDSPIKAQSGYLREIHRAICSSSKDIYRRFQTSEVFDRASEFFELNEKLRFNESRPNGAMADLLVAPWVNKIGSPTESLKSSTLVFLRKHLGDPRINQNEWKDASSETSAQVRAWLSQLTLDAFFSVIGQFASNARMTHQWARRRAFWEVCLRKGLITDSWLALGDNVARSVRGNRELKGSFGLLSGGDANHSVLLMKINNLIFAEWSHNGALRAWPDNWRNIPELFRQSYFRSDLIAPCLQFPRPKNRPDLTTTDDGGLTHHDGIWQGRVTALLKTRLGIILEQKEWDK